MRRLFFSFLLAGIGHVVLFFAGFGQSVVAPRLISDACISVTLSQPSVEKEARTKEKVQPVEKKEVIPLKEKMVKQVTRIDKTLPDTKSISKPTLIKPFARKKCFPQNVQVVENIEDTVEATAADQPIEKTQESIHMQEDQGAEASKAESSNAIVEAQPLYQDNPKPEYPALAQRRGWQGIVLLAVSVLENGKADHVRLYESCGYPLLDKAASKAVRKWLFLPGTKDGIPVKMEVLVPVKFLLAH